MTWERWSPTSCARTSFCTSSPTSMTMCGRRASANANFGLTDIKSTTRNMFTDSLFRLSTTTVSDRGVVMQATNGDLAAASCVSTGISTGTVAVRALNPCGTGRSNSTTNRSRSGGKDTTASPSGVICTGDKPQRRAVPQADCHEKGAGREQAGSINFANVGSAHIVQTGEPEQPTFRLSFISVEVSLVPVAELFNKPEESGKSVFVLWTVESHSRLTLLELSRSSCSKSSHRCPKLARAGCSKTSLPVVSRTINSTALKRGYITYCGCGYVRHPARRCKR